MSSESFAVVFPCLQCATAPSPPCLIRHYVICGSMGPRIFMYSSVPEEQLHRLDADVLERPVLMAACGGSEWSVQLHGWTSGQAVKNAGGGGSSSGATAPVRDLRTPGAQRPSQFRVTFPPLDKPLPVGDAERWAMYQSMCSCELPAQQLGPCVHAVAVIAKASTELRRHCAAGVELRWQLRDLFHSRVRASGMCCVYRAMKTVSGLSVDRAMLSVSSSAFTVEEPLWLYPDAIARAASAGWRIATATQTVTFNLSATPLSRGLGAGTKALPVPASAAGHRASDRLSTVLTPGPLECWQPEDGSASDLPLSPFEVFDDCWGAAVGVRSPSAAAVPVTVLIRGGGGDGAAVVTVLPPQSRAVIVAETPSTMHAAEQPSPRGLEERQNVRSRQLNFAQASRRQHSHGELQLQDMRRAANLKSSARRDDGALIDWGQGSVTPADHGTPASVLGSPTGSWKPAQLPVGTAVPLPLKRGQPIQYYVVCSLRVALVVASRELRAAGHGH